MDRHQRAEEIAQRIVESCGCYLLRFTTHRHGKRIFIKVVAEYESGINIDRITTITKQLKNDEEFDALFDSDYHLEVTSSGLDYRLKTARDFRRKLGKEIKIFHHSDELSSPITGILREVEQEQIRLETKTEQRVIPLAAIDYGKIVLKW